MKFKVNGRELEALESFRIGEACEAERALGIDLADTGLAGKMAVALFISMRRDDPERSVMQIADEVMGIDMAAFEEVEEESPPAETPAADEPTGEEIPGHEHPPTTGALRSVQSA
jgi:hypothetical protein